MPRLRIWRNESWTWPSIEKRYGRFGVHWSYSPYIQGQRDGISFRYRDRGFTIHWGD